ncbi:MAG: lipopolysaccharide heptosyltransferase I [Burkholderiales bacterium]|nr:lipopolysaccharide heptosyltransferase I [Burkholderiales bacterium]
MKVLIVKTSSMGDVVHALPVLSDIKVNFADCEIDWLVEEPFADIVRATSLVRKVHLCKVRKWRKAPLSRQTQYEVTLLRQALKSEQYDLVIDLQGLYKSAILARLASSPVAGYDFSSAREGGASLFYNKKYQVSRNKSAVMRCRELAAKVLGYSLPLDDPDFRFDKVQHSVSPEGRKDLSNSENQEEDSQRTVIFFVNASRKTKLWPEDYWIALGKKLAEQGYKVILPWGSQEDLQRVNRIATGIGKASEVLPHSSIGQLMKRIFSSSLIVGLDTGMTHLSSAMGVPTVGLFLDYPIELVPLVGKGKKIALGGVGTCPQCEEVLQAVSEVLK